MTTDQRPVPDNEHPRHADNERLRRFDDEVRGWFNENEDERDQRRLEFALWAVLRGIYTDQCSGEMSAEQSLRERLIREEWWETGMAG